MVIMCLSLRHVCKFMIDMSQIFRNQCWTEVPKLEGKIQSPYYKNKNLKIRSCPCRLVELQPCPSFKYSAQKPHQTTNQNSVFSISVIVSVIPLPTSPYPLVCLENPFPYFSSHFNLILSGEPFLIHLNHFYSFIYIITACILPPLNSLH